jgi:hypothetical protein
MFTAGEAGFGGEGNRPELGWTEPSPGLAALASALERLVAASDSVAAALVGHDRTALENSNELASALVDEIGALAEALTEEDRADLPASAIPGLRQKLSTAARRNAHLLEQAWAVDAALMRLLLGVGRAGPDSTVGVYNPAPGPAYVDRGA